MGICAFCYIWNLFGVVVFQRSIVNLRRGVGSVCHDDLGICAFYYIWNCFGVVVLHRSIVNWGDVSHGYMCILLYVKLIWCGVPEMYGWLPGCQQERERPSVLDLYFDMGCLHWICPYFWMDIQYFYLGYPDLVIYDWEGGSVCHWFMCILSYVKAMKCSGVAEIYGWLMGGHLPWVYVHSFICQSDEV